MIEKLLKKALNRLLLITEETPENITNDVKQLISEAVADIVRIGVEVPEALFKEDAEEPEEIAPIYPIIEAAILCYVSAVFGENPDREQMLESYHMYLTKLKG